MSSTLFQLKITLLDCHVNIWRKLVVPADIKLSQLHDAIQTAMGWRDCHLHMFVIGGASYGVPSEDDFDDDELFPEKKYRLDQLVNDEVSSFLYVYDFGDDWQHLIDVESFDYRDESGRTLLCLNGKGSCPPEDVGSAPGYEDFCAAINKKSHPEHEEMKEWVYGCGYPETMTWPDGFDIDAVNKRLAATEKTLKPATKKKPATTKAKKKKPASRWMWMPPEK